MRIDAGVVDAMSRHGRVVVRISGGAPGDQLFEAASAANHAMVDQWDSDDPTDDRGEPVRNPVIYFAVVPPELYMSVSEIDDVTETYRRLSQALETALPADTRLDVAETLRPPGERHQPQMALLELRVALQASWPGVFWQVAPGIGEPADDAVTIWLLDVGPDPTLEFGLLSGDAVAIRADQVREAIRAQRRLGGHCIITASDRANVRAVNYSHRSAHVSLLAGTLDPGRFDWSAALDQLTTGLHALEPLTQSAFVRYTSAATEAAFTAHSRRQLHTIANRAQASIQGERQLEEAGLVDAQGLAFLADEPADLAPGWTVRSFGHLHQLSAPNLDDWFAGPPSEATIQIGRDALSPLLRESLDPR